VLVGARPPLIAFNVELAPGATLGDARAVAAAIREGGEEGLPGVRAIGLWLQQLGLAQVSTNVEDHRRASPAAVVAAVARHAAVAGAELVGLAPQAAFADFPRDVALRGYATIEDALHRRGRSA
jgi:glutamate formiminotransferase